MVANNGIQIGSYICQQIYGTTVCNYNTVANCTIPASQVAWYPAVMEAPVAYADWLVGGLCFKFPGSSVLAIRGWLCPPTVESPLNAIWTTLTAAEVLQAYTTPQPPYPNCTPLSALN